jgi:hypothetical protein
MLVLVAQVFDLISVTCGTISWVELSFLSGAAPQVNDSEAILWGTVTAVTNWEFSAKKGLQSPTTSLN